MFKLCFNRFFNELWRGICKRVRITMFFYNSSKLPIFMFLSVFKSSQLLCFVSHFSLKPSSFSSLHDLKSISTTFLRATFTCTNVLTFNFCFINIIMFNYIHYIELKVSPTFTLYVIPQKKHRTSIGVKAAHKMMMKSTQELK